MAVQRFAVLEFHQHGVALGGCEEAERELLRGRISMVSDLVFGDWVGLELTILKCDRRDEVGGSVGAQRLKECGRGVEPKSVDSGRIRRVRGQGRDLFELF